MSTIIRASMKNIENYVKKISRVFTTFNTQLKKLKESDSNFSDSEDEDEASHFQMAKIILVKVTSNLHSWTRNFNPASQGFSTRLPVVTSA